jgi:hypothetical protein
VTRGEASTFNPYNEPGPAGRVKTGFDYADIPCSGY